MKLEYCDGVLRIENLHGLRWQLNAVSPPALGFRYESLFVDDERAMCSDGGVVRPLSAVERREVESLIGDLRPPPSISMQKQVIADLRAFAHGLINAVVTELQYDGLLDVVITGRDGSNDLYAEEARRVLDYVDTVWNSFHGLAARIGATADAEMQPFRTYADLMPFPPPLDFFSSGLHPGLFDVQAGAQ